MMTTNKPEEAQSAKVLEELLGAIEECSYTIEKEGIRPVVDMFDVREIIKLRRVTPTIFNSAAKVLEELKDWIHHYSEECGDGGRTISLLVLDEKLSKLQQTMPATPIDYFQVLTELESRKQATPSMTDDQRQHILSFKDEDLLLMAYVEGQKAAEKKVQDVIRELERRKKKEYCSHATANYGFREAMKEAISLLKGGERK